MKAEWPKQCRDCDHDIYPVTWDLPGSCTHGGRNLCRPCWSRRWYVGTLDDVERIKFTRDELMAEWEILRGEGYSKRQAAERMGISFERFDRAFHRAKAAGDPRAFVLGSPARAAA
jgi:hypothetical protein